MRIPQSFAAVALVLLATVASADEAVTRKAQASAKTWLETIDAGAYASSWKEASTYFRGAVTEASWTSSLQGVRAPLGKTQSRRIRGAEQTKTAPGAPDGNYIVLQYDTIFEKKASAVETVTFVEEKDGQWRAAGYFIK